MIKANNISLAFITMTKLHPHRNHKDTSYEYDPQVKSNAKYQKNRRSSKEGQSLVVAYPALAKTTQASGSI